MTRRWWLAGLLALGVAFVPVPRGAEPPSRLADREFWQIVTDASEPNGYFRSDTLTSNELGFQRVIPELVALVKPGAAYLGVGPEQNFTYMAALRPAIAIILDIRRGNLHVHLMYKALFEMAKDRADFVSMLFSKPRPAGLGPASTAGELFAAFGPSQASEALYQRNLKAIQARLTTTHGLPLSAGDLAGIEYVYGAFFRNGFAVRPSPTYAELMTRTDGTGVNRSYLASEAGFAFLKDLQSRNLVVPVVGDFGGPKAIRAIGAFLKKRGDTVSAFYLSNVEQYLRQDGKWTAFCRSVATLPIDASSTFIRSSGAGYGGFVSSLGAMTAETRTCSL